MSEIKRAPSNTTEEVRRDPMVGLLISVGGIEAQERHGQLELVNSDTLPSDVRPDDKALLEAAGVVFGEPVTGDPMFVYVTLPEGWKKVATAHEMWSDLIDAGGTKRASIFYKAAFYDRRASMHAEKVEDEQAGAPV